MMSRGAIYQTVLLAVLFLLVVWSTYRVLSPATPVPEPKKPAGETILEEYPDDAYLPLDSAAPNSATLGYSSEIIDVHEHVQFEADGERLLEAMDLAGVSRTCLLGTPLYTFTLNRKYGFEKLEENNQVILGLKRKHPERFCVFVAIDPNSPDALETLQRLVSEGADGVKLYLGHGESTGHGPFHTMPLDSEKMLPVYRWAEETGLPVIYHVNLIKYYDEFDRVLQLFPGLRVNLPHFGLHSNSWARLSALGALLDRNPNLYFDMSYGWYVFHIQGFENLSRNRPMLRAFVEKYSDRAVFGADSVVEFTKSAQLLAKKLTSHRQMLELPAFRFYLKPDRHLRGLDLSAQTLRKIYFDNPMRFLRR